MRGTVSPYQTWRFDEDLPHNERAAFAACAAAAGVRSEMRSNGRFASTYVLLDAPPEARLSELAARYPSAEKFEPAIIALGIEPEAADALQDLADAFGGPGAPAGVASALVRSSALVLEFAPAVSAWATIKALLDVELARFGSTARSTSLLSPLSTEMEAQIAAEGLGCPELAPSRVLETFVQDVDR